MDSLFHLIGLCPDHYIHLNVIDGWNLFDQYKVLIKDFFGLVWQRKRLILILQSYDFKNSIKL